MKKKLLALLFIALGFNIVKPIENKYTIPAVLATAVAIGSGVATAGFGYASIKSAIKSISLKSKIRKLKSRALLLGKEQEKLQNLCKLLAASKESLKNTIENLMSQALLSDEEQERLQNLYKLLATSKKKAKLSGMATLLCGLLCIGFGGLAAYEWDLKKSYDDVLDDVLCEMKKAVKGSIAFCREHAGRKLVKGGATINKCKLSGYDKTLGFLLSNKESKNESGFFGKKIVFTEDALSKIKIVFTEDELNKIKEAHLYFLGCKLPFDVCKGAVLTKPNKNSEIGFVRYMYNEFDKAFPGVYSNKKDTT